MSKHNQKGQSAPDGKFPLFDPNLILYLTGQLDIPLDPLKLPKTLLSRDDLLQEWAGVHDGTSSTLLFRLSERGVEMLLASWYGETGFPVCRAHLVFDRLGKKQMAINHLTSIWGCGTFRPRYRELEGIAAQVYFQGA